LQTLVCNLLYFVKNYHFDDIYDKQAIMTPEDYNHEIQIANQELAYSKEPEKRIVITKKIQKLKYEREIAVIRKKIEQIS
jgi:hypothetical protein